MNLALGGRVRSEVDGPDESHSINDNIQGQAHELTWTCYHLYFI